MEKILSKKSFPQWVKKLASYKIYSPVQNGDLFNYEAVDGSEGINPDYPNTVLSPKKIIFPQREILLKFSELSNSNEECLEVKEILPDEKSSVIFGVRPCDAKALTLMDKVFRGDLEDPDIQDPDIQDPDLHDPDLQDPDLQDSDLENPGLQKQGFSDLYYLKRRDSTVIVGLACKTPPDPNCFCLGVNGSPHSKEGLDIIMIDLGDKYMLESLTEKGHKLINLAKNIFQEPEAKDREDVEKIQADSEKKIKRQIKDIKEIPPKLKEMFESSFWNEESLSCICCGICTYLCPTCHCFDINDEVACSSPIKGERVRTWDNCQFPDFTMHSSGHNPRPDKDSRLRQRIFHKFQYFVEKYQNYQCTGCGRCVAKCPVGIDIVEVLNKVRDYGS